MLAFHRSNRVSAMKHMIFYQARIQLGTPGGAKIFLRGAQIF